MGRKVLRKFAVIVMVSMICLLTGCGGGTDSTSDTISEKTKVKETSAERFKVAWCMMSTDGAVNSALVQKAEVAAEEFGIDFQASGADNDPSKQLENFEAFVEAGYDCIIVQAIDSTSMSTYTKQAMEQGIKIVAFGPALNEGCYDFWYRNDNTTTGTKIGEMVAKWINEERDGAATVCIIGASQFQFGVERQKAIETVLAEQCSDAAVVANFDAYSTTEGQDGMEAVLAANPEIDCIVAVLDDYAIGAYEACKAAGYNSENMGIFGSDLSTTALNYIVSETSYKGTTDVECRDISAKTIKMAYDLLTDNMADYQSDQVIMEVIPVTTDNAAEYVDYFEQMSK